MVYGRKRSQYVGKEFGIQRYTVHCSHLSHHTRLFSRLRFLIPRLSSVIRPLKPSSIRIAPLKPLEMLSFQNEVYPWEKETSFGAQITCFMSIKYEKKMSG